MNDNIRIGIPHQSCRLLSTQGNLILREPECDPLRFQQVSSGISRKPYNLEALWVHANYLKCLGSNRTG
jgi:hypothetical protein